jgi:hypothetical protein
VGVDASAVRFWDVSNQAGRFEPDCHAAGVNSYELYIRHLPNLRLQ